ARAEADASLTQTGLVTGSPAYISPEVASGRQATDLSDVWSLGATLYHALAGHPPYDIGDNVIGGLYRIVHEEPPRLYDADWLTPLLASSMVVDPQERWSMRQVVDFLHAGPAAVAPKPLRGRRPLATDSGSGSTQVMSAVLPRPVADPGTRASRRPNRLLPILGAVAVVALLTVIGVLIGLNRGDDDTDGPGSANSPSTANTQPSARVTAAGMEEFGGSYPEIASSDTTAGFALLTSAYQAESPKYDDFWGSVSNVDVQQVEADPEAMTVTYTYSYDHPELGRPTETIQLTLEGTDGDYLISGAETLDGP
ncbi:MAG: protein kinase, partial [Nocardioides sp.]|nr:protein kinase [Nocardioides sp.]